MTRWEYLWVHVWASIELWPAENVDISRLSEWLEQRWPRLLEKKRQYSIEEGRLDENWGSKLVSYRLADLGERHHEHRDIGKALLGELGCQGWEIIYHRSLESRDEYLLKRPVEE